MNNATILAPTFSARLNQLGLRDLSQDLMNSLERGQAVLQTREQIEAYLILYRRKHIPRIGKLIQCLDTNTGILDGRFQTVDWGCGVLMATYVLRDHLARTTRTQHHVAAVGTDASVEALAYGRGLWPNHGIQGRLPQLIGKPVAAAVREVFAALDPGLPTLHLAANFLDVEAVDSTALGHLVGPLLKPGDVFAAVSPTRGQGLDQFRRAAGFGESLPCPDWSTLGGYQQSTASFVCRK